jgi:hypothetical protein
MTHHSPSGTPAPQGLGPPGRNPLFWGVLGGMSLGVLAGVLVHGRAPAAALNSELVFRIEVGLIVALVTYWAVGALWLAWHQTLFRRLGFGTAGAEPPERQEAVEQRDEKVEEFMEKTAETLENHTERLEVLEEGPASPS